MDQSKDGFRLLGAGQAGLTRIPGSRSSLQKGYGDRAWVRDDFEELLVGKDDWRPYFLHPCVVLIH